jgi:hypothetical protein
MQTTRKLLFESQTCTRCGGCGEYSYNQRDGRTCYGCGGTGVQLTKRGAVAQAHYRSLLTRSMDQLKVGDVVQVGGCTMGGGVYNYFAPIVEIDLTPRVSQWSGPERTPVETVTFTTDHPKYGRSGLSAQVSHQVRIKGTDDERAAARKAALELQASLTKQGKPRARPFAEAA